MWGENSQRVSGFCEIEILTMMDLLLCIDRIKLALLKRLGRGQGGSGKCFAAWSARGYVNEPEVSVVIESHNKSLQVMHVVEKLRRWPSIEIIVVDDGSDEVHTMRLARGLVRGNEFLVRANDLYENVMYNKCMRFAQAPVVVLLQDDDDFDSLDWLGEGVELMREYPQMVILGGQDGFSVKFHDGDGRTHSLEENLSLPLEMVQRATAGEILSGDGRFRFVEAVNRAPMFVNRALFAEYLRDIPFSYAPFQYDDYEICLRAWLCGLQVGSYSANFRSLSAGGMRLWNGAFTQEQMRRNGPQLYRAFRRESERIAALVREANSAVCDQRGARCRED